MKFFMKKKFLLLFLLSILFPFRSSANEVLTCDQSVTFINSVCARYYFIRRFSSSLDLLVQAHCIKRFSSVFFPTSHFTHEAIERSWLRVEIDRSLEPFFEVWEDFKHFKYVENESFMKDFTKELFIIMHTLVKLLAHKNDASDSLYLEWIDTIFSALTQGKCGDPQELLSSLQWMENFIAHHVPFVNNKRSVALLRGQFLPAQEGVLPCANSIFERFYYLKRLSYVCEGLRTVQRTIPSFWDIPFRVDEDILECTDSLVIKNPQIILTLQTIRASQNGDALFALWDQLCSYQYLGNESLEKEFALILFLLYQKVPLRHDKNSIDSYLQKIEIRNFTHMSLEEILDAIDFITEELPLFIEKYELNSALTWKNWVQKHWFFASLAMASLTIRFVILSRCSSSQIPAQGQ